MNAASRRADGLPETLADTRFFDLRAMGYQGPIDQDGYPVSNPGPVATPGSNSHRTGSPNHLQGSGEESMIGAEPHAIAALAGQHPAALIEAIQRRLDRDMSWFLFTNPHDGEDVYSPFSLAVLVADIVGEYADHLVAERDALAEDLAWELHATRKAVA
jgi:hypothetical protein